MTNFLKYAGMFVVGAACVLLVVMFGLRADSLGGVYSQSAQYFPQGIYVGTSNQLNLENDGDVSTSGDAVISGGQLTVTSTNAATSSTVVGCIQTTATSTATPVRIVMGSSGATTTYTGAVSFGVVGWQFGSCPI